MPRGVHRVRTVVPARPKVRQKKGTGRYLLDKRSEGIGCRQIIITIIIITSSLSSGFVLDWDICADPTFREAGGGRGGAFRCHCPRGAQRNGCDDD